MVFEYDVTNQRVKCGTMRSVQTFILRSTKPRKLRPGIVRSLGS